MAFCAHAILQPDLFIVPDASKDARFAHNPLVTSSPPIRFYAGAPLISPDHHVLGTLCVLDRVPRELTKDQINALRALSHLVMSHLVQRRQVLHQRQEILEFKRTIRQLARSKQAAETVSRLKGDLLRQLGQQTQTRLGALSDLNKQVLEHDLPTQGRRNLRKAQLEANHLLTLSAELVDLMKMELQRAQ
jgi:GAF domain-containing protein